MSNDGGVFDDEEWRDRRDNIFNAIVDEYDRGFFNLKTLLELGAGHGHLGERFRQLGSRVTSLEGRLEHVKYGNELHPDINFICHDLDSGWIYQHNKFDIVLHIGVLYHLENPELNLASVCESMKSGAVLVLETEFVDTDDRDLMLCLRRYGHNLSVRPFGCRPSHGMIEDTMKRSGISFKKMTSNKYDHPMYIYSSPRKHDGSFDRAIRGFWFGVKN